MIKNLQLLNHTTYIHATSTEWITFVHGAGGSSNIWFKQIRSFSEDFNLLVLDLRGHGDNNIKNAPSSAYTYTFDAITADIFEVIEFLKIQKSHFVGISLGTILIRNMAEKEPNKVISMVMGGAIMKMNLRTRILTKAGVSIMPVIPAIYLYQLFAYIMMPRKNHKKARLLFVREAKKLYQDEFIKWFKLTSEINPLLRFFRAKDIDIPTLYIMGEEDYLFLPAIKKVTSIHKKAKLHVVPKCGHVVNVEKYEVFNEKAIEFIKEN